MGQWHQICNELLLAGRFRLLSAVRIEVAVRRVWLTDLFLKLVGDFCRYRYYEQWFESLRRWPYAHVVNLSHQKVSGSAMKYGSWWLGSSRKHKNKVLSVGRICHHQCDPRLQLDEALYIAQRTGCFAWIFQRDKPKWSNRVDSKTININAQKFL